MLTPAPLLDPSVLPPLAAPAAKGTPLDDLQVLYAEHHDRIFRFLLLSLRDAHAAASLTQDTFLRAWNARATFRGDCAPATWLTRIAIRLLQNHTRGKRFRFWQQAERTALNAEELGSLLPAPVATAEHTLLAREQLASVFAAVDKLPMQQRTAFLLRFTEELELPEIAASMNISPSAAKTHLYRALQCVRMACLPAKPAKEVR